MNLFVFKLHNGKARDGLEMADVTGCHSRRP
jgi:hypothetical protein